MKNTFEERERQRKSATGLLKLVIELSTGFRGSSFYAYKQIIRFCDEHEGLEHYNNIPPGRFPSWDRAVAERNER